MSTIYETRDPSQSTWQGRKRRGEKDTNSFATFVSRAKRSNEGKAHLKRHHGGFGIGKAEKPADA